MQDDSKQGYIYVLGPKDNSDFEVCKIGRTTKTPMARCAEINRSSTGDFLWEVAHQIMVSDCMLLETRVHAALSAARQQGREIFWLSPDEAMSEIGRVLVATSDIVTIATPSVQADRPRTTAAPATHSKRLTPYLPLFDRFTALLGVKGKLFNQRNKPYFGISDDHSGVQWNLAASPQLDQIRLGVNLEGKVYDNWPITTLIQTELAQPRLPALAASLANPQAVVLRFARDVWQRAARLDIAEPYLGGAEQPLDSLTPEWWQAVLTEALGCLDETRQYRGRGEQAVTRIGHNTPMTKQVSPHLTIWTALDAGCNPLPAQDELAAAIKRLKPLYAWARQTSGA